MAIYIIGHGDHCRSLLFRDGPAEREATATYNILNKYFK